MDGIPLKGNDAKGRAGAKRTGLPLWRSAALRLHKTMATIALAGCLTPGIAEVRASQFRTITYKGE
ncbi:MAG: hypothetical protein EHM53_07900 [Methanoregulaceae archaeon]|nr:MAG: hypothetical protein EHM53_07900 [Methanoregulaceae archaeon]